MKNIISELFYGNIDPQTRSYQKGSYIQKYMTILANAEEVLTKNLSGDDKKTFFVIRKCFKYRFRGIGIR